ncbi:hypothetical protein CANCADRAFT_128795 [Tortispora caseinolytica NRRL Y-17796]|uniref:Uncharacterized protein n=1 Tax=Tortispora caseinolytica NRRL Y-17796 TaxID=767744 RepID=A0A1E4TAI5_9ASCO|nr:hypothetical protein CANCADRAFT_128795 [Tortispora caseinolytica NRRL Y-17796]
MYVADLQRSSTQSVLCRSSCKQISQKRNISRGRSGLIDNNHAQTQTQAINTHKHLPTPDHKQNIR